MKICMVTTFYPPYNFGGDGIFVYRLANALARDGHEVVVVHDVDAFNLLSKRPPKNSYPHHPNVTTIPLQDSRLGSLDLLVTHQLGRPFRKRKRLQTILEDPSLDVIHFHNISLLGGPGVLNYGTATKICTIHECWYVCAMHVLWRFDREPCTKRTCLACTLHGRRPPQFWRYTGQLNRAVQQVDAFIAPSQFTREIYHANGFPAPIHHIPHFMPDVELVEERPSPLKHDLLSAERPYFLFAGRLEKIKGVQVLLDVFRQYDKADLVIAGDGEYKEELHQMAQGLSHVHFLGMLDHSQLRQLYAHAIATLVPSLCYETFGWPVLESFAMRTPVIVHDLSAPSEITKAAAGGLLYKTPESLIGALDTLCFDTVTRNKLGENGFHSVQTAYTQKAHLKLYYDLLQEVAVNPTA